MQKRNEEHFKDKLKRINATTKELEQNKKEGKVITVTSGKGGVGKSTTSANVAIGLAKLGKKVVVTDFDIGLRNLDMILGLENRVIYDNIDVMEGRCNLSQALIKSKQNETLYFLPASQNADKTALKKNKVRDLIEELKSKFDIVLIDSPAGIEEGFEHSIMLADEVLIVVNPEISSIKDADKVIGIIDAKCEKSKQGIDIPKNLIITRIKQELVDQGKMLSVDNILEILSIPLIGIVPEDDNVIASTNIGIPVIENSNKIISGKAYENITKRILGEEIEFLKFDEQNKIKTFLKKMFS